MEEILKDDPLKKPKKITLGFIVVALSAMMVCAFAAFHWLYADYFAYSANKTDALRHLEEIRALYAGEEESAKIRLAEVEARSKVAETDAAKRAKQAEDASRERIKAAEESSQNRIKGLDEEYAAKRKSLQDEFEAKRQALEADIAAKKQDLALLLRGFKERFDSRTNDLETAIQVKRQDLARFQDLRDRCADLLGQYVMLSNSLVTARQQRSDALKKEREAEDAYNALNGKVGVARSELEQLSASKDAIGREVETQKKELLQLKESIRTKTGDAEVLDKKSDLARDGLSKIEGAVKAAKTELVSIRDEIAAAKVEREAAAKEREDMMKRRSDADAACRKAEAERVKAENELAVAEERLRKRKPEIEATLKELEGILQMKRKEAEKATSANGGND